MNIVNVVNYEGLYCVTDEGDIFSLKRGVKLKPHLEKSGYMSVVLSKNGEKHTYRVHTIVFNSFNKRNNELVIDHIDGNKINNKLSNLRQIHTRENTARSMTNKYGRGVKYYKNINKYGSCISINRTRYYLGVFPTAEQASNAYIEALNNWELHGILPTVKDRNIKYCKVCGRELPIDDFYLIKGHGRSWMCKSCSREYSKNKRNTTIWKEV